jgi:hypothetical protein
MRQRFTELVSRFNGVCAECRRAIARNAPMIYDWHERKSYCKACGERRMKEAAPSLFSQ